MNILNKIIISNISQEKCKTDKYNNNCQRLKNSWVQLMLIVHCMILKIRTLATNSLLKVESGSWLPLETFISLKEIDFHLDFQNFFKLDFEKLNWWI